LAVNIIILMSALTVDLKSKLIQTFWVVRLGSGQRASTCTSHGRAPAT